MKNDRNVTNSEKVEIKKGINVSVGVTMTHIAEGTR